MSTPWLTLVTPTFNRAPMLREALASVAAQGVEGIEHLVIDGASTDATAEVVAGFPHARMMSERDDGIYDAINKGLRLARGEWIGLLNSDDRYAPGALAAVREKLAGSEADLLSGGAEIFRESAGATSVIRHYRAADPFTLRAVTFGVPVINARFFRCSFLERLGPLDLRYTIAADRELLIRAALAQPRHLTLDRLVYSYREHDDSLTVRAHVPAALRYRAEHLDIAERYLARTDLTGEDHATFRAWHRAESAILALSLAREAQWRGAGAVARRGCRQSLAWPLVALQQATLALAGRA